MNLRILPEAEYERLRAVPAGSVQLPPPGTSLVYVVEDEAGDIVFTWIITQATFADGLWKRDDQPKGLGAKAVLRILADLRESGAGALATITDDPVVLDMAHRLGFTDLPGQLLLKEL